MKRILTLAIAAIAAVAFVSAQTFTPSSANDMSANGVTISFAKGSGNTAPTYYENGLRLYASNTITISGANITSIQLVFSMQGTKPYASLSANVGSLVSGGKSTSATDNKTDSWTGSASSVTFTLGASGQRLIHQIIVNGDSTPGTDTGNTGTGSGTGTGTGTGGGNQQLNPSYVYSEPTSIVTNGVEVSHAAYQFVQNNIGVSCSDGAVNSNYFSVYAGGTITFTTTQPMKGLTANAFLKKDFSATASVGNLIYLDASQDTVVGDPALIVTNINATSITLTCAKQIRFYRVDFYFAENPDTELDGDAGLGEYSYDYEPTEQSTFNFVIDDIEVTDMAANLGYTATYLEMWNNDAYLAIVAFVPYDANTAITPGTYPINFSYEDNTIEASVGGDEDYDFESFLMTNYETIGDDEYYDPYYIVSGTLTVTSTEIQLNATSYFGSTINATYTFPATMLEHIEAGEVKAQKRLENGRVVILRDGIRYNALGMRY